MALFIIISVAVLLLLALGLLLRRLVLNVGEVDYDPGWVEEFSIARYRPMLRLLVDEDYEFLKSSPGCTPAMLRELRAERRAIFRVYLRNLVRDFNWLHRAARMLALDSPVDRPELAADLVRARASFVRAVVAIQFRLALHSAGLGSVDARELLGSLEGVCGQCRGLVPATSAAAA